MTPGTKKEKEAYKTWKQLETLGVVEKVKAGTNTDYSSALHLALKPGGGAILEVDEGAMGATAHGPGLAVEGRVRSEN